MLLYIVYFHTLLCRKAVKTMNVAILGFGVVGSGVAEVIKNNCKSIEENSNVSLKVTRILDIRDFPDSEYKDILTKNFEDIASDDSIDIVVETMGGVSPAFNFVSECLKKGKHVVSSNKELVATKGYELLTLARENNVNFLFEASVGGGIPIIRPISRCLAGNNISEVAGILNGTSNFILTKMIVDGMSFEAALKLAQDKGYAEKDPTADVEGLDDRIPQRGRSPDNGKTFFLIEIHKGKCSTVCREFFSQIFAEKATSLIACRKSFKIFRPCKSFCNQFFRLFQFCKSIFRHAFIYDDPPFSRAEYGNGTWITCCPVIPHHNNNILIQFIDQFRMPGKHIIPDNGDPSAAFCKGGTLIDIVHKELSCAIFLHKIRTLWTHPHTPCLIPAKMQIFSIGMGFHDLFGKSCEKGERLLI